MTRVRIEREVRRHREDRWTTVFPVLPLDPRDPDVVRAKRLAELRRPAGPVMARPYT